MTGRSLPLHLFHSQLLISKLVSTLSNLICVCHFVGLSYVWPKLSFIFAVRMSELSNHVDIPVRVESHASAAKISPGV